MPPTVAPTITLTALPANNAVQIEWTNVANETGYEVQRKQTGTSTWRTVAVRPRQETGGMVHFGSGQPNSIQTTANYGPGPFTQFWDGQVRNMNEPKWIDYTVVEGDYDYRVVALGCQQDGSDGIGSPTQAIVITSLASAPVRYIPVSIFPNPAQDMVNIEFDTKEAATIMLYDVNGQTVKTVQAGNRKNVQLSTSNLTSGVYFVEIRTETGATRSKLVVK